MPRKTRTNRAEKNGATAASPHTDAKNPRATGKKPARKKTATVARRMKTSARSVRPTSAAEPSDEMVRIRAYFIAERRHRLGLPGDAGSDWLEAKRQLLSELGPR